MNPNQQLTKCEREVMRLLCLGLSNKAVAEVCHLSIKTVEKHRQSIYYKWNVGTTTALIRFAIRHSHFPIEEFLASSVGENSWREPQKPEHMLH